MNIKEEVKVQLLALKLAKMRDEQILGLLFLLMKECYEREREPLIREALSKTEEYLLLQQ